MKDFVAFLRANEEGEVHETREARATETTVLSREIGVFYERLRFAVDNKEEHFFRRYAIRRAVRRVSLFSADAEKLLRSLVSDLERGGYLREDVLVRERREQAFSSLSAFVALSDALRTQLDVAEYHQIRRFLLDIIAGALEDALYDTTREEGVVVMMARSGIASAKGEALVGIPEDKKRILFYVASWRSLFSADSALLRYKLWLFAHPHWDNQEKYSPTVLAGVFRKEIFRINHTIDHPFGTKLLPRLHNLSIAHTLIYDAVCEYGTGLETLLADRNALRQSLRVYIARRYNESMSRVKRRSLQSILYIFVTKAMLAVAIESIYVVILKQALNYLAIVINLTVHPALLFVLTGGVRAPDNKNTDRAVALTEDVVFGKTLPPIELPKEKKGLLVDIALGCYVFLLLGSVWGIVALLSALQFHLIDIVFFILFLLLVLYFGYRIRFSAYRMRFAGAREGLLRTMVELCLLPLVSLGRFMSVKFERINLAVFFLDFIIESPLRLLLRFFDTFSSLVDKKRDEIYTP